MQRYYFKKILIVWGITFEILKKLRIPHTVLFPVLSSTNRKKLHCKIQCLFWVGAFERGVRKLNFHIKKTSNIIFSCMRIISAKDDVNYNQTFQYN